MTERTVTCILCPNGCELDIRFSGEPTPESIEVEGNLCPRGVDYAIEEILHPKRTLTTSVLVRDGTEPQASVKTVCPIPREKLLDARTALQRLTLDAPVAIGDVIFQDVAGTGIDVIVTRAVDRSPTA